MYPKSIDYYPGPIGHKMPSFTALSVLGFLNGNYGSSYGKLCATKEEREAKRLKRKAIKKAQQRNRIK